MQLKYIFALIIFSLFGNAFGYDCKVSKLPLKSAATKKIAYKEFAKENRQSLVESLLFEITQNNKKSTIAKKNVTWLLEYLEGTEQNPNQRAFIQLLSTTSESSSATPKKLDLTEVCDIMRKVNNLGAN